GFLIRIAGRGTGFTAEIVGKLKEEKLGKGLAAFDVFRIDLLNELRCPVLVRDVEIEAGICSRCVSVKRLLNRQICQIAGARTVDARRSLDPCQIESASEVIERHAVPCKMIPKGSSFR